MTSIEFHQARQSMGLTQHQLGRLIGMPQNAISRIESGARQPTRQQAAALRLLLFLQQNDLLRQYVAKCC